MTATSEKKAPDGSSANGGSGMSLFANWTDEQLRSVSGAIDAAAREGSFGNDADLALADALRDEAVARSIHLRSIVIAGVCASYARQPISPTEWRKGLQ